MPNDVRGREVKLCSTRKKIVWRIDQCPPTTYKTFPVATMMWQEWRMVLPFCIIMHIKVGCEIIPPSRVQTKLLLYNHYAKTIVKDDFVDTPFGKNRGKMSPFSRKSGEPLYQRVWINPQVIKYIMRSKHLSF